MEARTMGYLEEYARELRMEFDALMDRSLNDRDEQAGVDALQIVEKIRDIRAIIRHMSEERQKHL